MTRRPPVGSAEWRAEFERSRDRFDRIWPYWVIGCVAAMVIGIVLLLAAADLLPAWLFCVLFR